MSEESGAQRATIGLSWEGKTALASILDKKWFNTGEAAFRTAVAFAIARDVPPTQGSSFTTTWNVGTIDRHDFKALIDVVLERQVDWDEVQRLGDAGLREIARLAAYGDYPLQVLMGRRE